MKNYSLILGMMTIMCIGLTSCEALGGIFKAGVWTGFIIVAIVVAIIIFIISKASKK